MKTAAANFMRILWLIIAVSLLFSSPKIFRNIFHSKTPQQTAPVLGTVPDFALANQNGNKMSPSDFRGKIWVANFIFTRCAGVCPLMSNKMRVLQEKFAAESNIRFVSFSVEPDHDTPEILQQYSRRFNADSKKWFFLTGDKDAIYRLSEQHFHLGVGDIPVAEREIMDQAIRHSSKFVLIDAHGKIRGYYDTENVGASDTMEPLIRDAKELLAAA